VPLAAPGLGDDQAPGGLEEALVLWTARVLDAAAAACAPAPAPRARGAPGAGGFALSLQAGSPPLEMSRADEAAAVRALAGSSAVVLFSLGNP